MGNNTKHPVVYLKLGENSPTTLFQSKVGGKPYLPIGMEYPKNRKTGNPLTLLAQINFAEMPPLPDYPTKGILQFFVDRDDEGYGQGGNGDFSDVIFVRENCDCYTREELYEKIFQRNGYDVIYHADILPESELQSDFSQYPTCESHLSWNSTLLSGEFPIAVCDKPFKSEKASYPCFHQIGGEPIFTQNDIFYWMLGEDWDKHHKVLFQLDSERSKVRWGDFGAANFFITPEDLKNLDFSKVVYAWSGS